MIQTDSLHLAPGLCAVPLTVCRHQAILWPPPFTCLDEASSVCVCGRISGLIDTKPYAVGADAAARALKRSSLLLAAPSRKMFDLIFFVAIQNVRAANVRYTFSEVGVEGSGALPLHSLFSTT